MNKRIKKRERTNYAPEFETMEELDKALTLDEFLLAKQAERSADRTIRDYKTLQIDKGKLMIIQGLPLGRYKVCDRDY